jgi:DNA-binding response OmpR family regulator
MQPAVNKKKVFVIEDDPFLVKAYQSAFVKENMEVWMAQDGETAITFLDREAPDIVLLDLMLPGMNGFEVLGKMRNHPKWREVPVIIVSNLGDPADIEKGKKLGVVEYKVKVQTNMDSIIRDIKHHLHLD